MCRGWLPGSASPALWREAELGSPRHYHPPLKSDEPECPHSPITGLEALQHSEQAVVTTRSILRLEACRSSHRPGASRRPLWKGVRGARAARTPSRAYQRTVSVASSTVPVGAAPPGAGASCSGAVTAHAPRAPYTPADPALKAAMKPSRAPNGFEQ